MSKIRFPEILEKFFSWMNGIPCHNTEVVRNCLSGQFIEWVGSNGNVPSPPRSPDLIPLDFFYGIH